MQAITSWTGGHADALRKSLRMTNESFAGHLGVGVRTVANWRKDPTITPKAKVQEILDTALERAPDRAKAQFAELVGEIGRHAGSAGPVPAPPKRMAAGIVHENDPLSPDDHTSAPTQGAMSASQRTQVLISAPAKSRLLRHAHERLSLDPPRPLHPAQGFLSNSDAPTIEDSTPRGREATMRSAPSRLIHALRPAPTGLEVPALSADAREPAQPPFSAVLTRWRERRGLSRKKLAAAIGFDTSYLSQVEVARMHASELFARKAEEALDAGGELAAAWRRDESGTGLPDASGLIVEDDHAELSYDGAFFHASQRRILRNGGPEPVTRYLMRISVDRYPGQPERSNALYRARPLTWDQLGLAASCDGEPMTWEVKADRDAFKEAWLCFENDSGRFPLYPGQQATINYSYTVDDGRWGPWFQRAVRLPTRRLSVSLAFPTALDPVVWGTETSATAEAIPLRTMPARADHGSQAIFSWATADPPVGARYRLEWRFRNRPDDSKEHPELRTAADRMKAAGIVQDGDPILQRQAVPFRLPEEAGEAEAMIAELFGALQRAGEQHVFSKGMGVAAPQIGIPRAAAIVIPPDPGAEPVVMLNPRIISESAEVDEQYEGCLSFFDVRGLVPRPLHIEVACTRPDGQEYILALDNAMARLAAHEIDHLNGRLYISRMRDGTSPIPVAEYRGTGHAWAYPVQG